MKTKQPKTNWDWKGASMQLPKGWQPSAAGLATSDAELGDLLCAMGLFPPKIGQPPPLPWEV